MQNFLLLFALLLSVVSTWAQEDTTIYKVVEEMPRFPSSCETLDTTIMAKQACANQAMLQYVYQRVIYPQEAINENISGTAVVTFVIEKDGSITQPSIARDLGGGTGLAALGVVLGMQEQGIKWRPGRQNGEIVRVQFNLPVRFRLQDPDPYIMVGADTVYTTYDEALQFEGGAEALQTYLDEVLKYPNSGNDSCLIGQIDIQILIEGDGNVRILNITDYNDLGPDFWYNSIDAATSTFGQWTPAVYEGRSVSSALDLSLSFSPTVETCSLTVDAYIEARTKAEEGAKLYNEGEAEAGLALMTEALEVFPNDGQLLIARGQAYLNNNQLAEACEDLKKARRITLVNWFDNILPLICN
ncbi:MAG: energy transducer TonB [Bacteroidota bacterium]